MSPGAEGKLLECRDTRLLGMGKPPHHLQTGEEPSAQRNLEQTAEREKGPSALPTEANVHPPTEASTGNAESSGLSQGSEQAGEASALKEQPPRARAQARLLALLAGET